MEHILKLRNDFWKPVFDGEKNFEVRLNDRGFQKGDLVRFRKVVKDKNGKDKVLKTDKTNFEITYVLNGWGLKEDYVVFGIKRVGEL